MVGFADDAIGQPNMFYDDSSTPEEILQQMQHDAHLWSDLLWIYGGLLELDKCLYHFIYEKIMDDGTPMMVSNRPGPPLQVKPSNNTKCVEICYKNTNTPHDMLGHKSTRWQ
eukprot:7834459-Ditylum_brightwellii.AAC.1